MLYHGLICLSRGSVLLVGSLYAIFTYTTPVQSDTVATPCRDIAKVDH